MIDFWKNIPNRRKKQLVVLFFLMVIGAVLEMLTLGSIVPFMSLVVNSGSSIDSSVVHDGGFLEQFGFLDFLPRSTLAWAVLFCAIVVISGGFRAGLSYLVLRFAFGVGHEISVKAYENHLYQPYVYHVNSNSSEFLACIDKCNSSIFNVLLPVLNCAVSLVISIAIVGSLIAIDHFVAVVAGSAIAFSYLFVILLTRVRLHQNSVVIAEVQTSRIKAIQEGLGGIRDVLLENAQKIFVGSFSVVDVELRKAQISSAFLSAAPRFMIESVILILIALVAVFSSSSEGNVNNAIPMLSAMGLGAMRLFPQLQQIFYGWTSVRSNYRSLENVASFLDRTIPSEYFQIDGHSNNLCFEHSIDFDKTAFRYPGASRAVLDSIDLHIKRGERVGFVGKTGSGKSTLIDILMGLLAPTSGGLMIDGVKLDAGGRLEWRKRIAHVPQQIFLSDASLAENIAFGVPRLKINMDRVRWAAEKAQVLDAIEQMPEGFSTMVGERGVKLSGGQRQRLGIARALYRKPDLLVLDEATSALDSKTESLVMDAIFKLDDKLTVVVIAHRLSTLAPCDSIYEVADGMCQRRDISFLSVKQ
ncbi:MAG: ABC transporter ATP-binding protein [Zoogloea sp.]|uniref:ABC transporter ATP-binding protein n=1 Tax=Zoogloea sp. TaxID=49181 RepID=UPI00260E794F|nr:ABC transporter ATP-binding protein [Zoogloea sp.]MDD2989162.1 ABC transporter ATP-binding protein [Zoogloea sp.]